VIPFEINAVGIATFELERDAPWSIDMNRIAGWVEPLKRVIDVAPRDPNSQPAKKAA
jgi:hypothetical protein